MKPRAYFLQNKSSFQHVTIDATQGWFISCYMGIQSGSICLFVGTAIRKEELVLKRVCLIRFISCMQMRSFCTGNMGVA